MIEVVLCDRVYTFVIRLIGEQERDNLVMSTGRFFYIRTYVRTYVYVTRTVAPHIPNVYISSNLMRFTLYTSSSPVQRSRTGLLKDNREYSATFTDRFAKRYLLPLNNNVQHCTSIL